MASFLAGWINAAVLTFTFLAWAAPTVCGPAPLPKPAVECPAPTRGLEPNGRYQLQTIWYDRCSMT